MSTLVYHAGALGDFITAVPALRYFQKNICQEPVTLLCNPCIGEFAVDQRLAASFLDVNRAGIAPLFRQVRSDRAEEFLSQFTCAIFFVSPDSPLLSHARSAIPTCHAQLPFPGEIVHAVDYHLSLFVDPSILNADEKTPLLSPSPGALAQSFELVNPAGPFIVIHPGSGSRKKNWTIDRFAETAEALRKAGFAIVWIRGPADTGIPTPEVDFTITGIPLVSVVAACSRACLFIGNDSGLTHCAAALNTPTIALFGPSDPRVWGPRGRRVRIISRNICAPCHRVSGAEQPDCSRVCLDRITLNEVIETAFSMLS